MIKSQPPSTKVAADPLVVVSAVVVLGILGQTGTASATDPCNNPHCYGQVQWFVAPHGFHGAATNLRINCMSVGDVTSQVLTNELWVTNADASLFIEAGIILGAHYAGGYNSTPQFFWADWRPGSGGFHQHFYTNTVAVNTYYSVDIQYRSDTVWDIHIGGTLISGTGWPEFSGPSQGLESGNESSTSSAHTFGSTGGGDSLLWKGTGDTWVQGWSGTSSSSVIAADSPMYAYWLDPYLWLDSGAGATC